uniref:Uncharacterized protein n=1 Tax=Sciurus vulgaris TaxID=55149 RepID=A0A8D2AIK5_SCIVU
MFPSQTKKKCPELNKLHPQLSLLTVHSTQEEDISFQTANISINDQSKGMPKQEALQESPLGSFNYLLSQPIITDLRPNLDLQDDEILHDYNPWPITSENKITESNASVIEISDDLVVSSCALQNTQVNEAKSEGETLSSTTQYACDFNLILEDSGDNRQNSQSLEHVGKKNSLCDFVVNSRAGKTHLNLDHSNKKDDEPEEVVVNVKSRRKERRIISVDEDEDDCFEGTSNMSSFSTSSFQFSSVKQFDASTPQNDSHLSGRFFSPKIPDSVNKSINSRRFPGRFDSSSETDGAKDDLEEKESDEASEHTEEGPSREMLSSENKFIGLTVSKPLDSSSQTSISVPKPLSDEVLVDSPQDKSVEAADDYENLVTHRKELKECGKIQEALNCFVKALDIKSADPEQLNNT